MVQWVKNPIAGPQLIVTVGSIPGLVRCVKRYGFDTAAVVQVATVAGIQSLAWELPYAVGAALKKKKKKLVEDLNRHFPREDIKIASKHLQRCSASLVLREMQSKTITEIPPPIYYDGYNL